MSENQSGGQKPALSCHPYAFLTVAVWASAYIFSKMALQSLGAGSLGFLRCFIASLVLGGIVLVKRIGPPRRADIHWFFVAGLAGLSLYLLLYNRGQALLGPTTSCILIATSPIFTAILATALFREFIRPAGWFAIGLAFVGVVVMSLWDGDLTVNRGVLWTLAAAFSMACYNIVQRMLSRRYAPLQITAYTFFAGTLMLTPFMPEAFAELARGPASLLAVVVFLGVFPSAISYLLWGKALSIAPKTSHVSNYMFLTPVLALLFEFAIEARFPDAGTLVGGAVVLASLILFSLLGRKK